VDEQGIADLLDAVRKLRTTLAIDLSAAAGALEDGRPEIARDILSATSHEVTALGERAFDTRSAAPRNHPRRRRILLALPVVPLIGAIAMTAAAAIGGSGPSTSHNHHHAIAAVGSHRATVAAKLPTIVTPAADHESATTTLHRLEHVVTHNPRASQVLAVAADLHQQLTAMIATSTDDPARLHVVRQLLTLEQHVLESSKVPGTQLALAASREIARLLDHGRTADTDTRSPSTQATPSDVVSPRPTDATSHVTTSTRHAQPTAPTHATAGHTPTAVPSDTLFGKGLFGRH
jgi:hypothetical protein